MSAATQTRQSHLTLTPWHMIAVGGLTMVWYSFGLARYGVTGTAFPFFAGWTQVYLAACLWGGFAGGALLMLRSRWAVQAFTTSLVGLLATSAKLFVFAEVPANIYAWPTMFGMWIITLVALHYSSRVYTLGLLDPTR